MKKIFVAIMAIAAISFSSCGNSAQGGAEGDSISVDSLTVEEPSLNDAKEIVSNLTSALQAGNVDEAKSLLEKAQAYVQELINGGKAEAAVAYAEQVKAFINEHKAEVEAITSGNETLAGLVSTISSLPTDASDAVSALTSGLSALGISASDAVNDAAENVKEEAKKAAEEAVQNAKDEAKAKAEGAVNDAKEKAGKAVDDAANKLKNSLGI